MRTLKIITALMGILIIAGTAVLATLIVRRLTPPAPATAAITLRQPPGTRLVGLTQTPAGLAVALTGAGPDRILILDSKTLRIQSQLTIAP